MKPFDKCILLTNRQFATRLIPWFAPGKEKWSHHWDQGNVIKIYIIHVYKNGKSWKPNLQYRCWCWKKNRIFPFVDNQFHNTGKKKQNEQQYLICLPSVMLTCCFRCISLQPVKSELLAWCVFVKDYKDTIKSLYLKKRRVNSNLLHFLRIRSLFLRNVKKRLIRTLYVISDN